MTELTDKAPCYDIGNQTDFTIPVVKTPWRLPQIKGVSKKTLVEDNELFIFEDEVEPLLSVLCGKTLEQARMEVLEEEELAEMTRQQVQYRNLTAVEQSDIGKMETEERTRIEAHTAKKALQRSRQVGQVQSHQKIVARTAAKQFLRGLKPECVRLMFDCGVFYNRFEEVTLKTDVMPWLLNAAEDFVKDLEA